MIYTNKYINIISLIISIILFLIINICFIKIQNIFSKEILNIIPKINLKNEKININEKYEEINQEELEKWYIEIPKINLKAPIAEGTDEKILNTKVGHFQNTSLTNGNIGLAGHNIGNKYNYFQDLKKLKIDDEIIYKYEEYKQKYIIDKIEIIKNTDWRYLYETEENKITLITYIENEPQYRRCIQATEKEN